MARMPGAVWRPIAHRGSRMAAHDILCWHTMVGSLNGTDSYFRSNAPGGPSSHFGVGHDGTIYQWVDTDLRAAANLNGNHHIISVETADVGTGFPRWNLNDGGAVPAWTAAQVEANAKIAAWVHKTHGIPLALIPDSKPGRRGNGYHRQGVPGYMVSGGERWSNAVGKVCPGSRRIAQIPQIIARAKQLAGSPADVNPKPAPVPEDDMAAVPQNQWEGVYKQVGRIDEIERAVTALSGKVDELATALLEDRKRGGVLPTDTVQKASVVEQVGYMDASILQIRRLLERLVESEESEPEAPEPPPAA